MYRPEGWDNPFPDKFYRVINDSGFEGITNISSTYEAGADAMLESLKKGIYRRGFTEEGKWVFIPSSSGE